MMTTTKYTRYVIHDSSEETFCDWCGRLLTVGDWAYPNKFESVFCCDAERREWNKEERESHVIGGPFDCPANA